MKIKIARLSVVACAALVSACSHYQGNKLDTTGTYTDKVRGIPFQMTKPAFTVNITPNTEDPAKLDYTLAYDHVADANHRYSIALDPALLTDGNFEWNFGPHGNLGSGNAAMTGRTIAVIQAVAATALQVKGGLLDTASVYKRYVNVLSTMDKSDNCKANQATANTTVKLEIAKRLEALKSRGDREAGPGKGAKVAFTEFHYLNVTEKACLADVHASLKLVSDTALEATDKAYKAARKDVSDPRKMEIAILVAERDTEGMRTLYADISKQADSDGKLKPLAALASAALSHIEAQDGQELQEVAFTLAYMDDRMWRARHVLYLERELQAKNVALLLMPKEDKPSTARAKLQAEIAQLESERRATLESTDLYARMEKIGAFLSVIRDSNGGHAGGPRFAADEHIKLAAEQERLAALIDKQKSELLAANNKATSKKDKIAPRLDVPVPLVASSFVRQFNDKSITPSGADTPPLVLVLEADSDPSMLATPAIAAAGGK